MNKFVIGAMVLGMASSAFASGFRCEGDGYSVKLYNKTVNGTRVPSALIVSHEDASPRTLLSAHDEEISKTNRVNTVRYTVDGAEMGAKQVILQIRFKEGKETLGEGEEAPGQLIIVSEDGDKEVTQLECARYLKGE